MRSIYDEWASRLGLLRTPAFVYDESALAASSRLAVSVSKQAGCALLYSLKSLAFDGVLNHIGRYVSGFSTSSLFEAQLVRDLSPATHTIHICAPAYREAELQAIAHICDYISFNSLRQYRVFKSLVRDDTRCGLRVNPQYSFVADDRYNPCREYSKLGVALDTFAKTIAADPTALHGLSGLHFHNNCDSTDLKQLSDTAAHLDSRLGRALSNISWINLGGGYLFEDDNASRHLSKTVELLNGRYGLEVFIEPGAAIVRRAGYLVATILDIVESDGMTVAILDASINHAPEVFEYQYEPNVIGASDNGKWPVILAGCSCLAGDLFGQYAFDWPLEIGDPIVFTEMGAYTTTKWHTFNGINLPSIYALTEHGTVVLKKTFTYDDFAARNGVNTNALV